MAERKTRVAILFGGRSAEHDVSRASAANVLRSLDPNRYDITLIGIARDGQPLLISKLLPLRQLVIAHRAVALDHAENRIG